jgi:uncharacterized membrane protein
MPAMPAPNVYHRWVGWHAPALRQSVTMVALGLITGVLVALVQPWQVALVAGWDGTSVALLAVTWPMILRADGAATKSVAEREDPGRFVTRTVLLGACVASLVGVGTVLALAGRSSGSRQIALIFIAFATVVLSWIVVNTLYTLRYAQLRLGEGYEGVTFPDDATQDLPSYKDFVYVAFTIGMTYQVSDTAIRDRRTRATVLSHSLLAYLFGVVIIAGSINLIAGLVR